MGAYVQKVWIGKESEKLNDTSVEGEGGWEEEEGGEEGEDVLLEEEEGDECTPFFY